MAKNTKGTFHETFSKCQECALQIAVWEEELADLTATTFAQIRLQFAKSSAPRQTICTF